MSYDYKDKRANVRQSNQYLLAKTLSMFEWRGLPETIPSKELERLLQEQGYAFITKVEGELYAFAGGLGGVPDVYGNPTQIFINNPALNFNKSLDLKEDGVLILSDSSKMGLMPLFNKYNTLLVESDITMTMHSFNTRMQKFLSASDDKTFESAKAFMKKVIDGELSVIGEHTFFEGIKTHQTSIGSESMKSLIEYHQYTRARFMAEIGIAENQNMKRERMVTGEIDIQLDASLPFVYDMLINRLDGVKKLNDKYETEITTAFGSVWGVSVRELCESMAGSEYQEHFHGHNNPSAGVFDNGNPSYPTGHLVPENADLHTDVDEEVEEEEVKILTAEEEETAELSEELSEDITTVEEGSIEKTEVTDDAPPVDDNPTGDETTTEEEEED